MATKKKAARSQPRKTVPKAAPKMTIVRDAKPTDEGFIGHFDQVVVRDAKGKECLVNRSAVA